MILKSKSCFFSEKKSSKDGKGRTPNSAETRAHVLAERLAARAWNERFATHDVTSWEQVMAEMDKNMAATLWKTSEFVPKSSWVHCLQILQRAFNRTSNLKVPSKQHLTYANADDGL